MVPGAGRKRGRGWSGDPETDIPALSFPKHVSGLHSCDDLAFNKVRRRLCPVDKLHDNIWQVNVTYSTFFEGYLDFPKIGNNVLMTVSGLNCKTMLLNCLLDLKWSFFVLVRQN